MQTPERRPPVGVAFDSSMGDSIDQVLALGMVLAYNSSREIRLASLSISRNNLQVAAFCDLMSRFFGSSVPIGMLETGSPEPDVPPMISAALSRAGADGKPSYARTVAKLTDTADPVALIRNGLTAQQDQNAVIVLAGSPATLLGMLALPGALQLIEKKVRSLVISASARDRTRLGELLAKWPGPIVFAGEEVGQSLKFSGQSIEEDFTYAANHPIVDAYRAAGTMPYEPYDAPASALAAVLHAIHPGERYFALSEPGTMSVRDGRLEFAATPGGKHRRLLEDPQQKDKVLQIYRQVVSTKPPERRGARGPQP